MKKVNPASIIHLTEKPVELAVRAIQYSSLPGENVAWDRQIEQDALAGDWMSSAGRPMRISRQAAVT